jgi:hypothetical protein
LALTRQEKLEAQAAFAAEKACKWCGGLHQRECNRIRRQVWHPNSNLIEIEFWPEWKQPGVIWPEDAFDDEDPEDASGR